LESLGGGATVKRTKCSTRPRIKFLDQSQLRDLFRVAKKGEPRDLLLVTLLYRYGLRVSEAIGLRADAVDLRRGEITVQGAKGGTRRTYAIARDILPLLRRYRPAGPFLFASREGEQMSRTRAWQVVVGLMREAGIPAGYGPHSLRHSLAVGMLDAGLQLEHVKDALRHASIRSTEVYAEVSPAARAAYTRTMEQSAAIVKMK
jgi:site-specific recombinase XerD